MDMKINLHNIKHSRGLSLVELMVAMTVSAILMLGISEIFSINSRSYKVQDENARMQENGRFAFNTLMQDIRRAGYFGGSAAVDEITGSEGIATPARDCISSDTTWGRMVERAIYGLNDNNSHNDADGLLVNYTSCIPTGTATGNYLRGDILVTRYTKSALIDPIPADNRLYIRTSLFAGRLFTGNNAVNASSQNSVDEKPNAVRELAAHAYYVGPSGRNCRFNDASNNAIPIPALHREVLDAAGRPVREEVASGIENIQFQYGIDTDGDLTANRYVNANALSNNDTTPNNWTQVVTVRLWVLVRADCPTNGFTNTKTYSMGDITYDPNPNDGFKRQLYSTVVAVRN